MARVIELIAGGTVFTPFEYGMQFTYNLANGLIGDGLAVEWDEFIADTSNIGADAYIVQQMIGANTTDRLDQNGYGPNVADGVSRGKWYRRVIGVSGLLTKTALIVGGGNGGSHQHRYANWCITRYREPIAWLWRDGMPIPATYNAGATMLGSATIIDTLDTFPLDCSSTDSTDALQDDRVVERASSGRLRSRVYWERPKRTFELRFPMVTELERQYVESFFYVHRAGGASFLYRHRANYPAQRVQFAQPPTITPRRFSGKRVTYDVAVVFQEA